MRHASLYSSARNPTAAAVGSATGHVASTTVAPQTSGTPPTRAQALARRLHHTAQQPWMLWLVIGLLALLCVTSIGLALRSGAPRLTQEQLDAAVLYTLENNSLPSAPARAYEIIRPSVVHVRGYVTDPKTFDEQLAGEGTGVVIVDKGLILTNLHVVQGAQTIKVTFADGTISTAHVTAVQSADDLAVLQAQTLPDDLQAATMRSTAGLRSGDQVLAVGFPFGIGPSASAGVVSGLKREHRSPEGQRLLTNLIQFDAAVNPGNSGGPLVDMEGQLLGIVTGLLNPNQQRTFIGIGFAVPIENAARAAGMPPF